MKEEHRGFIIKCEECGREIPEFDKVYYCDICGCELCEDCYDTFYNMCIFCREGTEEDYE